MEKRKTTRYSLNCPTRFRWTNGNATSLTSNGLTRDMSVGGVFVLGRSNHPVGASIELNIAIPNLTGSAYGLNVVATGTVIRVEHHGDLTPKGFAAAVRFKPIRRTNAWTARPLEVISTRGMIQHPKGASNIMKKAVLCALVFALCCGVSVAAVAAPVTANGGPVTLTAIIPSYIGFSGPSVQSVTFDYTNLGLPVAMGLPTTKLAAGASPSWTLIYNLPNKPTITVCAYASALTGESNSANVIPTSSIYSATGNSGNQAFQFNGTGCGQSGNAIVMDTIANATSSTGTAESLVGMFMQTPNGTVIPPDTYTGALNIIAQAQ